MESISTFYHSEGEIRKFIRDGIGGDIKEVNSTKATVNDGLFIDTTTKNVYFDSNMDEDSLEIIREYLMNDQTDLIRDLRDGYTINMIFGYDKPTFLIQTFTQIPNMAHTFAHVVVFLE